MELDSRLTRKTGLVKCEPLSQLATTRKQREGTGTGKTTRTGPVNYKSQPILEALLRGSGTVSAEGEKPGLRAAAAGHHGAQLVHSSLRSAPVFYFMLANTVQVLVRILRLCFVFPVPVPSRCAIMTVQRITKSMSMANSGVELYSYVW